MTPPILSGYVPTPVPGPSVIATSVPGPFVVPTEIPGPATVPTPLPVAAVVPTEIPGPAIVPTQLPYWVHQVTGVLQAQGEITVQVMSVELEASEALRGQGALTAEALGMAVSAPTQSLRGRGLVSALAGMRLPAGIRTLAGRGAIALQSAIMALPGGTRILGGRGLVTATRTGYKLNQGTKTVAAGRGQFQVLSARYPTMAPVVAEFTTVGETTYSVPYWWKYMDIILVGGGASGQTGSGANSSRGDGGKASAWVTGTVTRGVDVPEMASYFSVTVGSGGAQAPDSDKAGPNPGTFSRVRYYDNGMFELLISQGGSGTISGQNGQSPGNVSYQGVNKTGGTAGSGNGGAATVPGASGAGGNGGIFGSRTRGGAGAAGMVVLQFRQ